MLEPFEGIISLRPAGAKRLGGNGVAFVGGLC
jgi:hypothetical protein